MRITCNAGVVDNGDGAATDNGDDRWTQTTSLAGRVTPNEAATSPRQAYHQSILT